MKKNILAVALVAGLGLAGTAAAYTYGTNPSLSTSEPGLTTPENVAYQQLFGSAYNYTMTEAIIFDIEVGDNAVNYTQGFTVRVALNARCNPHNAPTSPPSPVTNAATCAATGDGAAFDTSWTPTAQNYDTTGAPVGGAGNGLVLDPTLISTWDVVFDGYSNGGTTASFRLTPKQGVTNPQNPSSGTLLSWNNAHLTSLNEFATGATNKVDAEFWMVNPSNDARFVNSTMSRTLLARTSGVTACSTSNGAETDKFIDVADRWTENTMPKSRFSFDGRLGSAQDSGYDSQWIDLGDVILNNAGAGNFAFIGSDAFTTVITAGAGDNWLAFDNDHLNGSAPFNDDVFLKTGSCASGGLVATGEVEGNTVTFQYTAAQAGLSTSAGPSTTNLIVCAYADSDVVIDDHNNTVTTTFVRAGNAIPTPAFGTDGSCTLLPLRYNGSTMEIFTINPASNTSQRSFVRLTNRSVTDGYVSLVGIDNAGVEGASQVRVWVPAGASVQLDSKDLENGTNGAIGAWGAPSNGKWRAVVTAEFPGLVATSLVNSSSGNVLSNITDSDTRGEQDSRDYEEGNFANQPGQRASDFAQETTPDFRGNGESTGQPGGPNEGWTDLNNNGTYDPGEGTPTGGTTDPCGNPGNGSGNALDGGHDQSNEDPYCYPQIN